MSKAKNRDEETKSYLFLESAILIIEPMTQQSET
jgi:hypothetical protein